MIYYNCTDLVTLTKLSMVQVGSLRDSRAQKKYNRCFRQSWEQHLSGRVSLKFFKASSKHWGEAKIATPGAGCLKGGYHYGVNHYPADGMVCFVTVFPVKPWTPEKMSGMFIVSCPIRCEMKPQKITAKPQHWLVTTWRETTSWLFLPREIVKFFFLDFGFDRIDMNDILWKSDVKSRSQDQSIRHS